MGSPTFSNAAKYLLKKLEIIQHEAIRLSFGAIKTSPTNALLAEAGELPLHIKRNKLLNKYLINKSSDSYKNHFKFTKVNPVLQMLRAPVTS